ncbi:MAG: hypothetical protein U0797_10885 [Gemmataceae bacterium]
MPHLLHGRPRKEPSRPWFTCSPRPAPPQRAAGPKGIGLGQDLYRKVGCVACRGTRDAKGAAAFTVATSVPLGNLKAKYTIAGTADFLADPLHARPPAACPAPHRRPRHVATYLALGGIRDRRWPGAARRRSPTTRGRWERPNFAS